ncbi:MAG: tetratricopeptide repeat protein [Myxococcales bacterium]|jgi:tetratricopeptide (TPR) repeat protein
MTAIDISAAMQRASAAMQADDVDRAFAETAGLLEAAPKDPEAAAARLSLWRAAPNRRGLREEVERIISVWPEDPTIVTRGCDALIRAAELLPPDQLPPVDGPATVAARAAERCLQAMGEGGDPVMRGYLRINRANGLRLSREHEAAREVFDALLEEFPDRGHWWFNRGLLDKAMGDYAAGLEANQRARELVGDEKPILWNIAICATALGQGEAAAEALRAIGFPAQVAESGMPYVEDLPPAQIRVATIGSGLGDEGHVPDGSVGFELVWVTPISPVHGVISSATYRHASVDYGDVVLWDGQPIGVAEVDGRPVPRFPVLARLKAGDEHRFRFVAVEKRPGQVAALGADLPGDCAMFIHDEHLVNVPSRRVTGDRRSDRGEGDRDPLVYGKIVVPVDTNLQAFRVGLNGLLEQHAGVQMVMPGLLEALGDSPAAGKAHQMWRGLEKTAEKHRAHAKPKH